MAKLPDNFPGFAALDAAGEATHAKLRKRIADGTLTEIPGVGEATAEKIEEAFEAIDTPDAQAQDMKTSDDDPSRTPASDAMRAGDREKANPDRSGVVTGDRKTGETLVNDGAVDRGALAAGKAEAEKPGTQKNMELANHALDQPTGSEETFNRQVASDGQRLAQSGAVVVDDPRGQYVSKTAVHIPANEGRIKVLPIGHTSPVKGMEIRDGDDVYVLGEEYGRDSKPSDWLKVRNPNTGVPLID